MSSLKNEAKSDIMKTVLRTAGYLLVVLSLCIGVSIFCASDAKVIEGQIGTVDLREYDFTEQTVIIPSEAFHIYPDVFICPRILPPDGWKMKVRFPMAPAPVSVKTMERYGWN